jgi:Putative transposase
MTAAEEGGCHARANGFDLHAGVVLAGQRERLERVCRYALRPPVAQEQLRLTADGRVRLTLRQPWRDGTTALVFDPVEVLGRLAVLVPRPRINLVLYHGVLGPRAAWRAEVVPRHARGDGELEAHDRPGAPGDRPDTPERARRRARGALWAALMQRT